MILLKMLWVALSCLLGLCGSDSANAGTRNAECRRYIQALEQPGVMARLEDWYRALPKKFDRESLELASGKFRIARYTIPLGFNPTEIGLRADAQAQLYLDDEGGLTTLYITDQRGVMFTFRIGDYVEAFHQGTLPEPRGEYVGITCLARD